MSDPNVIVGNSFKGKSKGKISFGGNHTVDTVCGKLKVGSDFDGEQEETSEIFFNETYLVKNVKNGINVDQPTGSTRSSNLQAKPLEDMITRELGFKINGHVTIFNQEFKNTPKFRDGSAKDVEYLKETFERLGIEAVVKPDLKYRDIVSEVDSLSTTDFSACKLFVCIFMSHGYGSGIVCAADKEFKLKPTIIQPIMENSSLNGIPEIFITVACRGSDNYEECDVEEFDGHILSTANGVDFSNCIISYSTYEGHVSKRTRNGTYFIQHLCDNINEVNGDTKIHSIFAEVNHGLTKMYKQVPVFKSTMSDISFKDLA